MATPPRTPPDLSDQLQWEGSLALQGPFILAAPRLLGHTRQRPIHKQHGRHPPGCDQPVTPLTRDYAILVLLVRLGLRAGEVAALDVGDIDWRRGELVVRGKGRRSERLPVPVDVGEAITGYLVRGRPTVSGRNVFLTAVAPRGPMSANAVAEVVRRACVRAGLIPVGAHRLRHTAATEMLRAGSSLGEVGQVLRHRRAMTTAIYAKVDTASLAELAFPWPGGRR